MSSIVSCCNRTNDRSLEDEDALPLSLANISDEQIVVAMVTCCYMTPHLHHNSLHVVELLRVEERGELLPRCDAVSILICHLEPPLVSGVHGFVCLSVFQILRLII